MATVHVDAGAYPSKHETLIHAVRNALATHPFGSGIRDTPGLRLSVRVVETEETCTDHSCYLVNGEVRITLHAYDLFDTGSGLDFRQLSERATYVLYHELAHFIDARIRTDFGYSDAKRPTNAAVLRVHLHLWCSFIDGRLWPKAPHSLAFRQANATAKVPPATIEAAWNGVYSTYDSLVQLADEIAHRGFEGEG